MENPVYKARCISNLINPSEETRKKMSQAKKGKPSWNKGKKWSPETIEKMRLAHKR